MRQWMVDARGARTQVAIAADCNIVKSSYSMLEGGTRGSKMSVDLLGRLAEAYGISFEQAATAEREYQNQKKTKGV